MDAARASAIAAFEQAGFAVDAVVINVVASHDGWMLAAGSAPPGPGADDAARVFLGHSLKHSLEEVADEIPASYGGSD